MANKAHATFCEVQNKAVVYRARFLSNVKAEYTVHFISVNGIHAYVDVNDGDAVAITLVHKPTVKLNYQAASPGTDNWLRTPYKLAVELLVLDRELRELSKDANNAHAARAQIAFRGRLIDSDTRILDFSEAEPGCATA